MPRHVFTREESQRGGRKRAAMPSMQDARSHGFWTTMERHPFFARHWLKAIIRSGADKPPKGK